MNLHFYFFVLQLFVIFLFSNNYVDSYSTSNVTIDILTHVKNTMNDWLNQYSDHIHKCRWQSTKSIKHAIANGDYFLKIRNLSQSGNHPPVLVQTLCIGHGTRFLTVQSMTSSDFYKYFTRRVLWEHTWPIYGK